MSEWGEIEAPSDPNRIRRYGDKPEDLLEDLGQNIFKLSSKVRQLELMCRDLGTHKAESAHFKERLQREREAIKTCYKDITHKMHVVKQQHDKTPSSQLTSYERTQFHKLAREFQTVSLKFEAVVKAIIEKEKRESDRIAKRLQAKKRVIEDDDEDEHYLHNQRYHNNNNNNNNNNNSHQRTKQKPYSYKATNDDIFPDDEQEDEQMEKLVLTQWDADTIRTEEDLAKEKNKELLGLEADLLELQSGFTEFRDEVFSQQEDLNAIHGNIQKSAAHVEAGVEEVAIASSHLKAAQKKMCIFVLVFVVLILVAAGILYFFFLKPF